jgi:hypothetical protein
MNLHTIYDVDGNVMYERKAPSQKQMIERLVKEGRSLEKANLAGAPLDHLDLSFADFTGANLDGANLTGCKAKRARFDFASMKGVVMDGVAAPYASFVRSELVPHPGTGRHASFVGASLPYSVWDRAHCLKVDWSKADVCSATFVGTYLRRCNFFRAEARNVDWVDSRQFDNTFDKANVSPRMKNTPAQFLPDRTKDALVVGNSYKGTVFVDPKKKGSGGATNAFLWDKRMTRLKNHLSTVSITGGLIGLGMVLPFDVEGILQGQLGTGVGFFAIASVAVLAKDKIEDFVKDQARDRLTDCDAKVRSVVIEAMKRGRSIGSLAVAVMSSKYADVVQKVIKDPEKSVFARFKAVVTGGVDVMVCDRKHLAVALSRLSDAFHGRLKQDQDVIMTRTGFAEDGYDAPNVMVLKKDGSVRAMWMSQDGTIHRKLDWADATSPRQSNEDIDFIGPGNGHRAALKSFLDAVVADNAVADFNFNPKTHLIRRGRNESIVVLSRKDGRMDNPDGPAIISKDDEMFYFRNAREVDEFGDPVPPPEMDDEPQLLQMR